MRKFCFVCGKKTEELEEGYCEECRPEPKIKKKKKKVYFYCTKCERTKSGRLWKRIDIKNLKIKKKVCEVCSRKFGDYYEAVIQLRGDCGLRHVDFITRRLKQMSKKDRMSFYFVKDDKMGFDIRIGSKKAARKVVRELREKYGCTLKKSFEIHGRKKGKELTRDFISCRF